MKTYFEKKIDHMKEQFLFREEALEQALLNHKLKSAETIEQNQMLREDIESQFIKFIY